MSSNAAVGQTFACFKAAREPAQVVPPRVATGTGRTTSRGSTP